MGNQYGKVHLNLSVDSGIVYHVKEKGINASAICEDALREILSSFDIST